MRIGMSGTGGVGKSTVLEAIKLKYPHLKQPLSSAREVFKRRGIGETSQRHMTPEALIALQEEISTHWLHQFQTIEGDSVWDRTFVDHYAYGLVRNHQYATKTWIKNRKEITLNTLSQLTHFFFFPIPQTWEPPLDSIRDPAPGTRLLVHHTMDSFLISEGIAHYRVPTDEPKEKVIEFVLDKIK